MRSVHYCPATKKSLERKYTDLTSLDAFPSSAVYPTKVRTAMHCGSQYPPLQNTMTTAASVPRFYISYYSPP